MLDGNFLDHSTGQSEGILFALVDGRRVGRYFAFAFRADEHELQFMMPNERDSLLWQMRPWADVRQSQFPSVDDIHRMTDRRVFAWNSIAMHRWFAGEQPGTNDKLRTTGEIPGLASFHTHGAGVCFELNTPNVPRW